MVIYDCQAGKILNVLRPLIPYLCHFINPKSKIMKSIYENETAMFISNPENWLTVLILSLITLYYSPVIIGQQIPQLEIEGPSHLKDKVIIQGKNLNYENPGIVGNALHLVDSVGTGEYVATIENQNNDGSGLKIKINGNHGMFIPLGDDFGIFPPHLPEPIDSLIQPILNKITQRILNGEGLSPPSFEDFIAILDPNNTEVGNLLKDLGFEELIKASICEGQEALVGLVRLPDLNLAFTLPNQIDDIPNLPLMQNTTIDLPDFPNPILNLPIPNVNFQTFDMPDEVPFVGAFEDIPYGFDVTFTNHPINVPQIPDIIIPAIAPFNAAIVSTNSEISTVNNTLENFLSSMKSLNADLSSLDAAAMIKSSLGCNNSIDFEDMLLDLPLPTNELLTDALSLKNHFLSFVDQGNRELGSVRAIHPTEWITSQVSTQNALEIASIIPGLISDDGNILENIVNLFKLGNGWIKGYNAIGVAYKSGFGDYAEWLPRVNPNESISYGDVVAIKSGKITKQLDGAEQVMVISKAPIVMGNAPDPDSIHLGNNVAFIGQVPIKVVGPVQTGDYIVADTQKEGYAKAIAHNDLTEEDYSYILGQSWENNPSQGFKFVQTIVGMHQNAWAQPMMKLQQQIKQLEEVVEFQTKKFESIESQIVNLTNSLPNQIAQHSNQ